MNRSNPCERFMSGCLLVAIIMGTIAIKLWVISVEQRLADNLEIHLDGVGTDHSQTNVLEIHERRLRVVERTAWAVWDQHSLCHGWPTQRQIANGK